MPIGRLFGFTLLSVSIVLSGIFLSATEWLPARILASGPMRFIGRISYGIYLYHLPIFHVLVDEPLKVGTLQQPQLMIALAVGLTFLTATLSYYLIEVRLLRIGRAAIAAG